MSEFSKDKKMNKMFNLIGNLIWYLRIRCIRKSDRRLLRFIQREIAEGEIVHIYLIDNQWFATTSFSLAVSAYEAKKAENQKIVAGMSENEAIVKTGLWLPDKQ